MKEAKLKECEVFIDTGNSRIRYLHKIHGKLWEDVLKNAVFFNQHENQCMLYGEVVKTGVATVLVLLEHGILLDVPAINVRIIDTGLDR